MAALDLGDTEQPIDPMLVKAIETAFESFSLPTVAFVTAPRAWKTSNPSGPSKGPNGPRKAAIKLELIQRDGFRCAYCARQFVDLDDATLDHVIPNCVVGHWKTWNLMLACEPCNNAKSDGVPLVLIPLLCHLLTALEPIARLKREQRQATKAARKAKAPRELTPARMRQRFYQAMRALDGPFVRPALEAAPARPELPAGGQA